MCIVPQGKRGDGSVWDLLYEWTLIEAGNINTALADKVFFRYCGEMAPVAFSRFQTYVINTTQAHGDLALMFSAVAPDGRATPYHNGISYWLDDVQVAWAHYPQLHQTAKRKRIIFKPMGSEPARLFFAAYGFDKTGGPVTMTDAVAPS